MKTIRGLALALLVIVLATLLASLSGCASATTGAKWYAPATWFSHAPADTADKAAAKQDAARDAAVKAAQKATHETSEALAAAPDSRPVAVAVESNASAVALLDQAAGPLTALELAAIRKQVAGLLSENATLRAEAEKARATSRAADAAISERLAAADAKVAEAGKKLREAFDRENELANELRSQRALAWILGAIGVLGLLAYAYLRYAVGGVPAALGVAMRTFRANHPAAADTFTPILDALLNRHEQAEINRHAQ